MGHDGDFELRLDMKSARKLKSAMGKGVWNKLTPKEAEVLEDFITELLMQVE